VHAQSWLNITQDDEQTMRFNSVLNTGDVVYLDPHATFTLTTTHAAVIEVFMNGEPLGRLSGEEGQEKQYTINRSSLRSMFANE
jgi:hypothetical protein